MESIHTERTYILSNIHTKEHTLGGTYTRGGYTQRIYTWRDIHRGDILTEGHTRGGDIYMVGIYTWRGHTYGGIYARKDIHTVGHMHGGDIHMERTYIRRDIYTEEHAYGGTYTRRTWDTHTEGYTH